MKKKPVIWVAAYLAIVLALLGFIGYKTADVDPFFHFHYPKVDEYFYPLNNQRSQNDGIIKNFTYQGLITGTSMTENFRTSEAEALWGCSFIKVPFSGGSYKEINDNIAVALAHNKDLKYVIRGLDMGYFFDAKDHMNVNLGQHPTYLYDDDPFNDVRYLFNRDILFSRVYPMIRARGSESFVPGITSFDDYSNWMRSYKFGVNTLLPDGATQPAPSRIIRIAPDLRERVRESVKANITDLADQYPDVTFYYFITPYSIRWWMQQADFGRVMLQTEAERTLIESVIGHDNIHLFSFNTIKWLITDLNNYKDGTHYGEWVNSLILHMMHDDQHRLTADNYVRYLDEEVSFVNGFDYLSLNGQKDYPSDYYAILDVVNNSGIMLGKQLDLESEGVLLSHAEIVPDQHNGKPGVLCRGSLQRNFRVDTPESFMWTNDYIGLRFDVEDAAPYNLIIFYGRKVRDHGQLTAAVYDETGKTLRTTALNYRVLDTEWHQYFLDLTGLKGKVTVIINGGYTDETGSTDSEFVISDVGLY